MAKTKSKKPARKAASKSDKNKLIATIDRRQHQGCESPLTCGWPRIVIVRSKEDYSEVPLCDFHRECIEAAVEHLAKLHGARQALSPAQAVRLRRAAWRATQ